MADLQESKADCAECQEHNDLVASNADLTVDYESARQHIRHQQEELDRLATDREALLGTITAIRRTLHQAITVGLSGRDTEVAILASLDAAIEAQAERGDV